MQKNKREFEASQQAGNKKFQNSAFKIFIRVSRLQLSGWQKTFKIFATFKIFISECRLQLSSRRETLSKCFSPDTLFLARPTEIFLRGIVESNPRLEWNRHGRERHSEARTRIGRCDSKRGVNISFSIYHVTFVPRQLVTLSLCPLATV